MRRRDLLTGLAAALAVGCTPERPALRGHGGSAAPSPIVRTPGSRGIAALLPAQHSVDGAGVSLTRHTAGAPLPRIDPFVLLDEIHSTNPSDYEAGFPSHPHRGFETVSMMLDGCFRHRDSRGGGGLVVPGGAQWMTAGSGIVHSEMPEQDPVHGTELWGFQVWVNLPRAEKWVAPGYEEIVPARVPEVALDRGGSVRVVAGELLGARGPVAPRTTDPVLATLRLAAGDEVELRIPREHTALVLAAEGSPRLGTSGDAIPEGALALLEPTGDRVRLRADAPAQVVLLAGAPIREPVVQRGPFVMNDMSEIEQAFADYRAGRLG